MRGAAHYIATAFVLALLSGCTAGRKAACASADPAPELPVVVQYVSEWDESDDSEPQDLRFAAWSDGVVVTRWYERKYGLTYHVGQVSPEQIQSLVNEIASFGVFELARYQFGGHHTAEEGVWVRCGDDAVRLDGVRHATSTFTSTVEEEIAFCAFLNLRIQAVLSISKVNDQLEVDELVPLRDRAGETGTFRGFNPEYPSSYSWNWARNEVWRFEPRLSSDKSRR